MSLSTRHGRDSGSLFAPAITPLATRHRHPLSASLIVVFSLDFYIAWACLPLPKAVGRSFECFSRLPVFVWLCNADRCGCWRQRSSTQQRDNNKPDE